MSKLKLLVGHWGRVVLCQVLEQDENLRAAAGEKIIYTRGGFGVKSWRFPTLGLHHLSIRGRETGHDNRRVFYSCENEAQAEVLVGRIKAAVADINAEPRDTDIIERTIILEIVE